MIKLLHLLKEVLEGSNKAPQGVIDFGNGKILVGDNHFDPVELSQDLVDKIVAAGKSNGYYGEGKGIEHNQGVMSSEIYKALVDAGADYKESWDKLIEIPKEEKYTYLATLFSNPSENKRIPTLMKKVKKGDTIFSLLSRTFDDYTEPGLGLSANDLEKFLKEISQKEVDFLILSKQQATKENLQSFLDKGENLMWGNGDGIITLPNGEKVHYNKYSTNAGKMAKRETDIRDNWLINKAGPGVYFVGSGHLESIKNMKGGKPVIDGSKINTASTAKTK